MTIVDSDNKVFHPLYTPPARERKTNTMALTVPNPGNFFSNENIPAATLQKLLKKSKNKKRGTALFTASEKHE